MFAGSSQITTGGLGMLKPRHALKVKVSKTLDQGRLRCCFALPSVQNLRSHFLAISMAFPHVLMEFQSLSITFNHFQSLSVTFNHVDLIEDVRIH